MADFCKHLRKHYIYHLRKYVIVIVSRARRLTQMWWHRWVILSVLNSESFVTLVEATEDLTDADIVDHPEACNGLSETNDAGEAHEILHAVFPTNTSYYRPSEGKHRRHRDPR